MVMLVVLWNSPAFANPRPGSTINFNNDWRFNLGEVTNGQTPDLDDSKWRALTCLMIGASRASQRKKSSWIRRRCVAGWNWLVPQDILAPTSANARSVFIDFDGVYRNSEVWINGHYLGKRPYGYISFEYDLTRHLHYGAQRNVIAVKVDNSQQPNSRWYSGSGIYRNVWLTTSEKVRVDHWGTYITTPEVSEQAARNQDRDGNQK